MMDLVYFIFIFIFIYFLLLTKDEENTSLLSLLPPSCMVAPSSELISEYHLLLHILQQIKHGFKLQYLFTTYV